MNNDLSLQISKLDFDFILDNCLKPKLWDKTWTIFRYGDYKVVLNIVKIEPEDRDIRFRVQLISPEDSYSPQWVSLSYEKENRNLIVAIKRLNNTVFNCFRTYEIYKTFDLPVYREAIAYERAFKDTIAEQAGQLLDSLNITNEDIREAYIDNQVDKLQTTEYTEKVIEDYKGKIMTSLYLSYCLFVQDQESYDYFKALAKEIITNELEEEIAEKVKELKNLVVELDKIN